jgi:hypothetical protein
MNEFLEAVRECAIGGHAALVNKRVEQAVSSGADRQDILDVLTDLMFEFRDAKNETAEELIMEIMDRLAGWCRPPERL